MRFRFDTTASFFPTVVFLFLGLLHCVSTDAQCNVAQIHKLLAEDGAAGDRFGARVAISGNTAIIGANDDDDNGFSSGSAYLFDVTTGQQLFKLLPSDGAAEDEFGGSVGIDGTIAIVGAWMNDDHGPFSGSAYLFDTTTGKQIAKLLPNDGASSDHFGISVAISGTTAIVGANGDRDNGENSGSAYLFDATTGQQVAKLLPADGAAEDHFGARIAIDGNIAIVGAERDDDNGENSGSAYLFNTMTGQQIAKLLPDDGEAGDFFGQCAVSGTTAIVGASYDDDNGVNSGSAYLFDTATGQQISKLLPNDGAPGDYFGEQVAIEGTIAVVGAHADDDNGVYSGSAYLFDTATGQQIEKVLPVDGAAGDEFGRSVSISGTTAIVGARSDDDNGPLSGSAYLFDVGDISCVQVVVPDSFLLTRGSYVSGGVFELATSDNMDLSLRRATADIQSRTEFEVKAVSPVASPSSLEVTLEGAVFARSQVDQTIELYDYFAAAWEQVDTRAATRFTDSTVIVAATGDLSRFVEAGTMCMKARIRYQSPVARQQFSSNTDQFIWMIGQ